MNWLKQNTLYIVLAGLVSFTVAYFLSACFRNKIIEMGIDAGMVAGLVASFALIFSIKQGVETKRQGIRDKNFAYRLSVKSKFDEMSQLIISKLYSIEARRQVCVDTLNNIKEFLGTDTEYRDGYNITSTEAFNADNFQSLAALDVYFPDQADKWNEAIVILNKMGTLASTAMLTYQENDCGRKTTRFLNDIDIHIASIKELDAQMGDMPKEIRNSVIEEVNKRTLDLTKV